MKLAQVFTWCTIHVFIVGCGGEDVGEGAEAGGDASAVQWHISVEGVQRGPFDRDRVVKDVRSGEIPPHALVWSGSASEWTPIWVALEDAGLASEAAVPDDAGQAFLDLCRRAETVPDTTMEVVELFLAGEPDYDGREIRRLLDEHRGLLNDARAGMSEVGSVGLQYAEGFELLLPHLAPARRLARLLAADAVVSIESNDMAGAAADGAALARIARQASSDGTTISALVAVSILNLAAEHVVLRLDQDALGARDLAELRESFAWYRKTDPFQLEKVLQVEKLYALGDIEHRLRSGDFGGSAEMFGTDARATLQLAAEDLDEEVKRCRELFDRAIAIARGSRIPAADRSAALRIQIERGDHGPLASVVVTAPLRAMEMLSREMGKLDAALAPVAN